MSLEFEDDFASPEAVGVGVAVGGGVVGGGVVGGGVVGFGEDDLDVLGFGFGDLDAEGLGEAWPTCGEGTMLLLTPGLATTDFFDDLRSPAECVALGVVDPDDAGVEAEEDGPFWFAVWSSTRTAPAPSTASATAAAHAASA
jgi:hypothetical protein